MLPTRTLTPVVTATSRPEPAPTEGASGGPANDPASVRVEVQRIAGGLDSPVGIANAGDESGRLYVVEKAGRIRAFVDGLLVDVPFLDISGRVGSSASEQGLLGLAFHPSYASNAWFFVNYTNLEGNTVIARFSASSNRAQADPSSEVVLLTVNQPAANHNGGHLAFGPDGYLYAGLGDGGGGGDQFGNGQNGRTLLGAMLRLDVDTNQPYAIPASNPFLDDAAMRDEIWAIGLRNPWRYSFDRLTGDLYIGDVGQGRYEEIDFEPVANDGGQNYGWPVMEGMHCFPEDTACNRAGLSLPVKEYDHSEGCSVTGGYVYRGEEFPLLGGIYLFGDYCSGRIWGLAAPTGGGWRVAELAQADVRLSSFGEDEAGELYLVDMGRGELFKIIAVPR
jgi:glucose/arabinose dehydrogenase